MKINEKDKRLVLGYIREILGLMKLSESGQVSWGTFGVEMRLEIIVSKLFASEKTLRKDIIRKRTLLVITQLKKKGVESPEWSDFEKGYKKIVAGALSFPKNDYLILFPLHADSRIVAAKKSFNVFGMTFKKVDWEKVRSLKGWNSYLENCYIPSYSNNSWTEDRLNRLFVPFFVEIRGRTCEEAFEKAHKNFELLRALVNFTYSHTRYHFHFGAMKPFAKYVFHLQFSLFFRKRVILRPFTI